MLVEMRLIVTVVWFSNVQVLLLLLLVCNKCTKQTECIQTSVCNRNNKNPDLSTSIFDSHRISRQRKNSIILIYKK